MATWDMWYIDKSFLVWIIPLTYQPRESIIWAYTTSFVHTCIIACLMYLSHVYLLSSSRDCFICMFSDSDLSIYMYLLHFRFTVVPLISFMAHVIACTCIPEPHHLIMYTCDCLSTLIGFILRTRWVAFWQPWTFMSRSRSLNYGDLTVTDQSGAEKRELVVVYSEFLSFQPIGSRNSHFTTRGYLSILSCLIIRLYVFWCNIHIC